MTDEPSVDEGAEETLEDLEAPADRMADVAGGMCPGNTACKLPTEACPAPTCTGQTYCLPGTVQGCQKPTCLLTNVKIL